MEVHTSMLMTLIGNKIRRWQAKDVGVSLGSSCHATLSLKFCRQHLEFVTNVIVAHFERYRHSACTPVL